MKANSRKMRQKNIILNCACDKAGPTKTIFIGTERSMKQANWKLVKQEVGK